MLTRRSTAVLLAGTLAAIGVAAPVGAQDASSAPLKIGVVTDVGQLDDKSFNQFSNQGAVDAATELGGTHDVIVTAEVSDYANNIQTFVDEDFDVIVTIGFLIGSDTLAAAKANPDVTFMGVDQSICVDENGENDATFTCAGDAATLIPNYQGILFKEAQPGYLVGIVAATISKTGVIGAVGGTNVPAVIAYRDGYINGAKSVNPAINVLYQESNPDPVIGFNDPERGGEIAGQMLDLDADVLFQIAGGTGVGVLEAACGGGAYGIGVDVDQAQSLAGSNPDAAACIVTSAEKKLQDTVKSVILSVADGTFKAGNQLYDAASTPPGIGISPFSAQYADLLTPDLQGLLDAATAGFIDGSIDPGAPTE
jgi:basic membrane protein A